MSKKVVLTTLLVAVIALIVVAAAVPMVTVAYSVEEPYETTETYYVQEAYTVQETYSEKEPFTVLETYTERVPYNRQVPVSYLVTKTEGYNYFWSAGCDARVWLRNTDIQSGNFRVDFHLLLEGGASAERTATEYIAIGDTVMVEGKYSGAYLSSWTYTVTSPTKTVTDYRDEQKTRRVTEYRDVQKTRDVTRFRDVAKQRTVTKVRAVTKYKKITPFQSWFGE